MTTTNFDEYISQNPEKWALNEDETFCQYPKSCVASVLKPSSG